MSYKSKLKLSALALSVGMACSVQAAYNPQFSEVYSFGDSLSDMGAMNNVSGLKDLGLPMPEVNGVFTTSGGSTAAGHLANNYGKTSESALKINLSLDQSSIQGLMMVGMALGSTEGTTQLLSMIQQGLTAKPPQKEAASAINEQLASINNLTAQLQKLPSDPQKQSQAEKEKSAVLQAELQRQTITLLAKNGPEIQSGLNEAMKNVPESQKLNLDLSKVIGYIENKKGNNFAIGGASAVSTDNGSPFPLEAMGMKVNIPLFQTTLKQQVDTYLERGKDKNNPDAAPKADPNALYTITAGANDLFRVSAIKDLAAAGGIKQVNDIAEKAGQKAALQKMLELTGKGLSSDEVKKQSLAAGDAAGRAAAEAYVTELATGMIMASAQEVATQTKRLMAAGAKYVMVTNMPDVTDTPDFYEKQQKIASKASDAAIAKAKAENPKEPLTEDALKKIGEAASAKAVAAAQAQNQTAVNGFNQMLQASLGKSSVIYVDINGFLKTVKADPQKFGFDTAKANQTFCDGSSLTCSPKDQKLKEQLAAIDSDKATSAEQKTTAKQKLIQEAAKNYIFADGVHPSSAVHKYLADVVTNGYLRAPGYNASMQSLARTGQNELAELFEGRRTALVANPLAEGELRPYVNISGSKRDGADHHNLAKGKIDSIRLYAAMDYGISEKTSGGIMLNVQRDKQDFKADMAGKQEREAYIAGAYLSQHITDNWAWGFNGYVGQGNYDQTRNYTIGDANNTNTIVAVKNTSETDSIMAGGSLGANGRYKMSGVDLLPRVNLNYQYERIKSYAEKTTVAGAVKFDDATLKRTELALGLNISKTFQVSGMAVKPYADIDWRQQLAGDKDQEVNWKTEGSTNGYINEVISETDRSFGTVKVGGQVEIAKGLTTQLSYNKKFGSSLSNGDRIMLDVGYTF